MKNARLVYWLKKSIQEEEKLSNLSNIQSIKQHHSNNYCVFKEVLEKVLEFDEELNK
jgi:hypothetical protein